MQLSYLLEEVSEVYMQTQMVELEEMVEMEEEEVLLSQVQEELEVLEIFREELGE